MGWDGKFGMPLIFCMLLKGDKKPAHWAMTGLGLGVRKFVFSTGLGVVFSTGICPDSGELWRTVPKTELDLVTIYTG